MKVIAHKIIIQSCIQEYAQTTADATKVMGVMVDNNIKVHACMKVDGCTPKVPLIIPRLPRLLLLSLLHKHHVIVLIEALRGLQSHSVHSCHIIRLCISQAHRLH